MQKWDSSYQSSMVKYQEKIKENSIIYWNWNVEFSFKNIRTHTLTHIYLYMDIHIYKCISER